MVPHADDPSLLSQRKVDHLDLCNVEQVEARETTTLLDEVHLLHDSLPELDVEAIDTRVQLLGQTLRVPLMISGMTGGADAARSINRILARVAQRYGLAMGVGSQRAMLRDPSLAASYEVRDVAPDILLCGNIGVVQAAQTPTAQLRELVDRIGANALCIHLNPGQEIVQEHGDRDFRGGVDAIRRVVEEIGVPVMVKETGCGISPRVVQRLQAAGVTHVDVSGVGGTTWVGVEALRARGVAKDLGQLLWDWGIPTAAAVHFASRAGMVTVASGGIRNGLDVAKAIAMGASVGSSALPWLRAAMSGGEEAAAAVAESMERTLRSVMLLTGSASIAELQQAPRVIGPTLRGYLAV